MSKIDDLVNQISSLDYFETKELSSKLSNLGIEPDKTLPEIREPIEMRQPMPAYGCPPTPYIAEKFKIYLYDVGQSKISIVKAIRELFPGASLSQVTAKVNNLPSIIAEDLERYEAIQIINLLQNLGAKVDFLRV